MQNAKIKPKVKNLVMLPNAHHTESLKLGAARRHKGVRPKMPALSCVANILGDELPKPDKTANSSLSSWQKTKLSFGRALDGPTSIIDKRNQVLKRYRCLITGLRTEAVCRTVLTNGHGFPAGGAATSFCEGQCAKNVYCEE